MAARPLLLAGPFCFRPPGAGNRPPYASTVAATTRYQSYLSHLKNIICTIKITYSNYTSYHLDHSPQSHCSTLPISLPMSLCRIVLPPCRKHLSKHSQAKFRKSRRKNLFYHLNLKIDIHPSTPQHNCVTKKGVGMI